MLGEHFNSNREYAMATKKPYLTESKLGDTLRLIFPNKEFIHNKQVPESGLQTRPDYRCDELMLIVEFNGNSHYQKSRVQQKDIAKRAVYETMGYTVVEIPYFVQLSSETIKYYFDVDIEWTQEYPHGFIDESCVLPADFNTLGVRIFSNEVYRMEESIPDVAADIIGSLYVLVAEEVTTGKYAIDDILCDMNVVLPVGVSDNWTIKGLIDMDAGHRFFEANNGYIYEKFENLPDFIQEELTKQKEIHEMKSL